MRRSSRKNGRSNGEGRSRKRRGLSSNSSSGLSNKGAAEQRPGKHTRIPRPTCGVTRRVRWFPLPLPLPTRADIAQFEKGDPLRKGCAQASHSTKFRVWGLFGASSVCGLSARGPGASRAGALGVQGDRRMWRKPAGSSSISDALCHMSYRPRADANLDAVSPSAPKLCSKHSRRAKTHTPFLYDDHATYPS